VVIVRLTAPGGDKAAVLGVQHMVVKDGAKVRMGAVWFRA
jgi:hypothetical protein